MYVCMFVCIKLHRLNLLIRYCCCIYESCWLYLRNVCLLVGSLCKKLKKVLILAVLAIFCIKYFIKRSRQILKHFNWFYNVFYIYLTSTYKFQGKNF